MTFIGRLKQNSAIWTRWRGETRVGGILYGVHFAWEPGNIYRTLPLTPQQITLLQSHDNIVLEVVGTDLPEPVAVVAKPASPVAAVVAPSKPLVVNSRPMGRPPGRA
jgi:hypothetical protein